MTMFGKRDALHRCKCMQELEAIEEAIEGQAVTLGSIVLQFVKLNKQVAELIELLKARTPTVGDGSASVHE